jgi:voltage-gated potassium channel
MKWRGEMSLVKRSDFKGLLFLVIALLVIGTGFYHFSQGWGLIDSLYFSVITLTTVGYGDLSPVGAGSRLFTIAYVLVGIGVIFGFINTIAKHRFTHKTPNEIRKERVKSKVKEEKLKGQIKVKKLEKRLKK